MSLGRDERVNQAQKKPQSNLCHLEAWSLFWEPFSEEIGNSLSRLDNLDQSLFATCMKLVYCLE